MKIYLIVQRCARTRGLGFYLATIDDKITTQELPRIKDNKINLVVAVDIKERVPHYRETERAHAVCFDRMWLVESKKVETIARGLRYKIARRLDSGKMADHSLFEKILKELNAESHFGAGDMEIDLDDDSIWINYEGLIGSNLFVDSFDITFSGLKSLTADCLVEVDEDDDGTLGQVEEHARRIKRTLEELSEEFRDLDPWEIFVLAQDEASICLRVHFSEESLGSLPSIPAISEFFENVLASAGVSRSL